MRTEVAAHRCRYFTKFGFVAGQRLGGLCVGVRVQGALAAMAVCYPPESRGLEMGDWDMMKIMSACGSPPHANSKKYAQAESSWPP